MDAWTLIGLLIFIVCAALLEQLVMNAIWDAGDQDESETTATEDGYSKETEPDLQAALRFKPLAFFKLHRTD